MCLVSPLRLQQFVIIFIELRLEHHRLVLWRHSIRVSDYGRAHPEIIIFSAIKLLTKSSADSRYLSNFLRMLNNQINDYSGQMINNKKSSVDGSISDRNFLSLTAIFA